MASYSSRPFRGVSDLPALIALAQATSRAPLPSYYHPGDFVWQLYALEATDDAQLWLLDDGTAAACAIFEPPLTFQFAIDASLADDAAITAEIVAWVKRRRSKIHGAGIPLAYASLDTHALSTWVMDDDRARAARLAAAGFTPGDIGGVRYARDLNTPLPAAELPAGAIFRTVTDAEAEQRAELHRAAWSVWGTSGHTTALYRQLRDAPLYDPDLDIVLEVAGVMVSYCVCWLDAQNRVGYFEPVGTRPSAAGKGYGRLVIQEGMRRLRGKGMTLATVGTAGVNIPAQALYRSAGFSEAGRERFYTAPV